MIDTNFLPAKDVCAGQIVYSNYGYGVVKDAGVSESGKMVVLNIQPLLSSYSENKSLDSIVSKSTHRFTTELPVFTKEEFLQLMDSEIRRLKTAKKRTLEHC